MTCFQPSKKKEPQNQPIAVQKKKEKESPGEYEKRDLRPSTKAQCNQPEKRRIVSCEKKAVM